MAEIVKKAKAPAKSKSTEAKPKKIAEKVTSSATGPVKTAPASSAASKAGASSPTRQQIAELAHKYWAERGGHHGSHEHDWLRAEQELRGKAS